MNINIFFVCMCDCILGFYAFQVDCLVSLAAGLSVRLSTPLFICALKLLLLLLWCKGGCCCDVIDIVADVVGNIPFVGVKPLLVVEPLIVFVWFDCVGIVVDDDIV